MSVCGIQIPRRGKKCFINIIAPSYPHFNIDIECPFVSRFQCWVRSDTPSSMCKSITPPALKPKGNIETGMQRVCNTVVVYVKHVPPTVCKKYVRQMSMSPEGLASPPFSLFASRSRSATVSVFSTSALPLRKLLTARSPLVRVVCLTSSDAALSQALAFCKCVLYIIYDISLCVYIYIYIYMYTHNYCCCRGTLLCFASGVFSS